MPVLDILQIVTISMLHKKMTLRKRPNTLKSFVHSINFCGKRAPDLHQKHIFKMSVYCLTQFLENKSPYYDNLAFCKVLTLYTIVKLG